MGQAQKSLQVCQFFFCANTEVSLRRGGVEISRERTQEIGSREVVSLNTRDVYQL